MNSISPAHVQRVAFIAVLSFLFFLAMMLAYYLRGSLLYFLLATAFLVVYTFTMISFVRLRKGRGRPPKLLTNRSYCDTLFQCRNPPKRLLSDVPKGLRQIFFKNRQDSGKNGRKC
ncbi:MAG: hypothetical protein IPM59_06190 [Chloracidobacterium sp.]|nr:hypothetical protein [Chloracidobacterium sp.]